MSAASALIKGLDPDPQLAEAAVRLALARANLKHANGVILYLTHEMAKQAGPALRAATRAAGSLQVAGVTAHGIFTETGWVLDQPAVAALVIGDEFALAPEGEGPVLSFCNSHALAGDWLQARPRLGLLHADGQAWQQSRLATDGHAEAVITGGTYTQVVAPGLKALAPPQPISGVRGLDVLGLGELSAFDSVIRLLPPDLRQRNSLPLHMLAAMPGGRSDVPAIPLLCANGDGSIALARPLQTGEPLAWGLRQPLSAEEEMRQTLATAAQSAPTPAFGLMFSCIARGPLFYGGDDRDLIAWRERFPGVPLIGAYGSGQLTSGSWQTRQWQNAAVTALFSETHV